VKKKAYKVEEMKAVNPGAKRLKMIYGPYTLRAANVRHRILAPELQLIAL
jgi:hypothetical protein